MKMTAEQALEKWYQNPGWCMTPEETTEMGREEFKHLIELCLDIPGYKGLLLEWLMKMYEPYFKKEVLSERKN